MRSEAEQYMERALMLARKGEGRTAPNPPVGAVVVRGGKVVGEGYHPRAGEPHAEIFALEAAAGMARGADLYVTLEPCSHRGRTGPCADAVIAAGIRRVFVGVGDPNPQVSGRGIERLRNRGIPVEVGVLEERCRRLIAPFAKHVTTGLPWVLLKTAVTLDGHTAAHTGDSRWVTGEPSRKLVHELRDRLDAIMVGVGTVVKDDPQLTTRLEKGGRDPLRVIVDSALRIPEQAAVLHLDSPAPTLIATTSRAPRDRIESLRGMGAEVLVLPEREGLVDLAELLRMLGKRGILSVLLEGGGRLNTSALEAGLIDRLMVFIAPKLLGGDAGYGIFSGRGVDAMAQARHLNGTEMSRVGEDILIEGDLRSCSPD